jgi:hypothetical protein
MKNVFFFNKNHVYCNMPSSEYFILNTEFLNISHKNMFMKKFVKNMDVVCFVKQ